MARSVNTWIFSLKVLLISSAVLSMAVILKLSVPVILEFVVYQAPLIWSSLLLWLRPPYLYFVINGIIITIAASSRFQSKVDEQPEIAATVTEKVQVDVRSDFSVSARYDESLMLKNPVVERPDFGFDTLVMKNPVEYEEWSESRVSEKKTWTSRSLVDKEDDFVISRSSWTPQRTDPTEYSLATEKPLVSLRFSHRKTIKASPEGGKALGVAKPRRDDTLQSTWKTITEGRPMPLTRHLRKSDTWETHGRQVNPGPQESYDRKMKQSETFNDLNSSKSSLTPSPGSGKLKKEPSLSQDELNRRVEAFIKKFNEEMRLQRQESLNQYSEMISRGTH